MSGDEASDLKNALQHVLAEQRVIQAAMKEQVRALGITVGYGNMMDLARDCWREHLLSLGAPAGGEFAVGPCVAMTVPCGCEGGCAWCGGAGWVTRRVQQVIQTQGRE